MSACDRNLRQAALVAVREQARLFEGTLPRTFVALQSHLEGQNIGAVVIQRGHRLGGGSEEQEKVILGDPPPDLTRVVADDLQPFLGLDRLAKEALGLLPVRKPNP